MKNKQLFKPSSSIVFALILALTTAIFLSPGTIHAQTSSLGGKVLSDEELSAVSAQAGISINFDITLDYSADTIAWGDRDGHAAATGPGWVGLSSLSINTLHVWPRTDYTMITENWSKLEMLTIDVVTYPDPETPTDPGELAGLDHITKLRIGIPTMTLSMDRLTANWMLGPEKGGSLVVGGQLDGTVIAGKSVFHPDLNQSLGSFEMRKLNLYTGEGGEILIGPHGTDGTLEPGLTGSGIGISASNTKVHMDLDYLGLTDTDNGNRIEFEGLTVDDGAGGYFSFDTPSNMPIMFDVGSDASGWTVAQAMLSHHTQPRTYTIDHLVFYDPVHNPLNERQDIGSLVIENFREGPAQFLFAAHKDGTHGMDFEYRTTMDVDSINYAYNTIPESLLISGIHIAGQATGSPEDPQTWSFSDTFMVGDLDGADIDVDDDPTDAAVPNPAKVDIGTDPATGNTTMVLGLPMKGTLRAENVSFGGNNFGPCAIDGIRVHHLNITYSPN